MSNIDKQALREEFQYMQDHYSDPADRDRQIIYIAAEALLDELDTAQHTAAVDHEAACSLVEENEELKRKLEAENQRNTALTAKIEPMDRRIAELEARAFNPAILDVIAERQRQQSVEGWTPEHDDQYGKSQLLWASSCYLLNTIQPFNRIPMDWPWDSSWWKPTNSRRDLVKAGALILAEIERIDRAAGIGVKGE
ncbi:ead/Ea22-like family protein [Salmonella enterica]|uniref:Ead/Ea22-like family protein n=1 Tax=Salmonella enterica TaxID=28901 RepID=A0A5U3IVR7_SALER|nr:ead/Ea22-like family protein [Salmonella enterica]